jgi:hypothetical protein
MKYIKLLKLIFIILPIAIAYGLFIAFTTLVEYIIDKAKIK